MDTENRRLASIVFTDIVGFTKLTAENEPLAVQLIKTQRATLKPIVEKFNGEWLKEIGDGLLLAFNTSKDAVDCSIEIQHTIEHVANLNLRIGIHQGEVIQQGNDILGDDVNVAPSPPSLLRLTLLPNLIDCPYLPCIIVSPSSGLNLNTLWSSSKFKPNSLFEVFFSKSGLMVSHPLLYQT